MTCSSSECEAITLQLKLKCAEPWDWILDTYKILADRKQVFLPTFYPKSNLVFLDSWRKLHMKLFPVQWDVNIQKWWELMTLRTFISYLPSLEAPHPGLGHDSTNAFWLMSSAPFVKEFPVKLHRISRGDGASPSPAIIKPFPLCSSKHSTQILNTSRTDIEWIVERASREWK